VNPAKCHVQLLTEVMMELRQVSPVADSWDYDRCIWTVAAVISGWDKLM